MKKSVIAITMVLYFMISSGLIVNLHYCMDRFSSVDFGVVSEKKDCGVCGMNKSNSHGCCHDEVKFVKIQDDQNKASQVSFEFASTESLAIVPSVFISTSFYNADEISHQPEHSPPLLPQQDLQVINSVFRI